MVPLLPLAIAVFLAGTHVDGPRIAGWKPYRATPLPPVPGVDSLPIKVVRNFLLPGKAHVQVHLDVCITAKECAKLKEISDADDTVETHAFEYVQSGKGLIRVAVPTVDMCCYAGICAARADRRAKEIDEMYDCEKAQEIPGTTESLAQAEVHRKKSTAMLRASVLRFKTMKGGVALVTVVYFAPNEQTYRASLDAVDQFIAGLRWRD